LSPSDEVKVMRTSIVLAIAAMLAVAAGNASAQPSGGLCDRASGPTPQCLGYNPYYVPPGSNQPVGFPTAAFDSPEFYAQARALRRKALGQQQLR
jgi:hypothetical protein